LGITFIRWSTSLFLVNLNDITPVMPAVLSKKDGPGFPFDKQGPLHLYTHSTPNGKKIQIALEELKAAYGFEFTWELLDISTGYQKEPWFLAICGNGRIPAITDNSQKHPVHVWESMAIYNYLHKYDKENKFHFKDEDEVTQYNIWMAFQTAGVGPMQGQANHFGLYAPEKIQYAIKRYLDETTRLYSVVEDHLSGRWTGEKRQYLAGKNGGRFSFADANLIGWVDIWDKSGVKKEDMDKMPNLLAWMDRVKTRPAVKRAFDNYNKE